MLENGLNTSLMRTLNHLIQPTLVDFPTEISPLFVVGGDPKITERFEQYAGREIANGSNELNDPIDQAGRFAAQAEAKDAGEDEAMFFDSDYIKALSYGMPPTPGRWDWIDRLVMLLTNAQSIQSDFVPNIKAQRQLNGVYLASCPFTPSIQTI